MRFGAATVHATSQFNNNRFLSWCAVPPLPVCKPTGHQCFAVYEQINSCVMLRAGSVVWGMSPCIVDAYYIHVYIGYGSCECVLCSVLQRSNRAPLGSVCPASDGHHLCFVAAELDVQEYASCERCFLFPSRSCWCMLVGDVLLHTAHGVPSCKSLLMCRWSKDSTVGRDTALPAVSYTATYVDSDL